MISTGCSVAAGNRWPTPEAQRALQLEQALENFWCESRSRNSLASRFAHRDSRFVAYALWRDAAQQPAVASGFLHWLAAAELEALVFHRAPGGTFTHFSCEHYAAASCTLELGKALPFGENDLTSVQRRAACAAALLHGEALPPVRETPRHYRVAQQITRHGEQFVLHMGPETLNFTAFRRARCWRKRVSGGSRRCCSQSQRGTGPARRADAGRGE